MADSLYRIQFTPTPGSYGTLIEYREAVDGSEWITPTSPGNPTMTSPYPLYLTQGKTYFIGLSSIGNRCTASRKIIGPVIVELTALCCPTDYVVSVDGTYCYKYDEYTLATNPSAVKAVTKDDSVYSEFGTVVYKPGWLLNGTGAYTVISPAKDFWINGSSDESHGPLNRCGLWAPTESNGQDIGFSVCINIAVARTYYVGVACDNNAKINLDGVQILNQDPAKLSEQFNGTGNTTHVDVTFKWWHIYPVSIPAGFHILEMFGHNDTSIAAFGAEVYDCSEAVLLASNSYAQLVVAPRLGKIFTTTDQRNQYMQTVSDGGGYSCNPGYALVACQTPYKCRKLLTTTLIPCP